jgi:UDP-glucuronate decarboxylase
MVDGLIRLMEQDEIIGPVNLGNPEERSIKEIAELIIKLTGSSSEIVYKPLPRDDPVRRQPDITLARTKLDWQPTVTLAKGLPKVIEYFRPLAVKNSAATKMPR